jgi:signal transduction histidine kinase
MRALVVGLMGCFGSLWAEAHAATPPDSAASWLQQAARYDVRAPAKALTLQRRAVAWAHQRADARGEANALLALSATALRLADHSAATRYALDVRRIAERLAAADLDAEALLRLGTVQYQQQDNAAAIGYYRTAVARARALPALYAVALDNLGNLLSETKQYAAADTVLRRAIGLHRQQRQPQREANALANWAVNEAYRGRAARGLAAAAQSVALSRQTADTLMIADNLCDQAYVWIDAGRAPEALALLHEAEALATRARAGQVLRYCAWLGARLYERIGRWPEALAAQRRLTALNDSVASATVGQQIAALNTRFRVEQQQGRIQALDQQQRLARRVADIQHRRAQGWAVAAGVLLLALGGFGVLYWQLRRSRASLAATAAALQAANQTKDQVLSIVGHDLRSPMAGFQHLGPLLLDLADHPDPAEQRALAHEMQRQTHQVSALLDNLLDWARTQAGPVAVRPQAVRPVALLTSIFNLYKPIAEAKGVTLMVDTAVAEALVDFASDPALLLAILRNLTANAVKFTPSGGTVRLGAVARVGGGTCFTVADTGIGLAPAALARALAGGEVASTPGTAGEPGTGLGLPVVVRFVALLGGTIHAESTVGAGTRWAVAVPNK